MVDADAVGRVATARQMLTEAEFARIELGKLIRVLGSKLN